MISKKSFVAISFLLLCKLSVVAAARDDVLVIVNDNSVDSPQVGAYYAQQRGINPANIVHVRVPDSYFISWDDFRRLRDQLIRFMQQNTMDDPTLTPVVCANGDTPYYCQASMDQLRAHTQIRYLVTTRGLPTRMTVDSSSLSSPDAPTSVDNYLKYWLINYFSDDVQLKFTEREISFADGRGLRTIDPATDNELIVGRIDGLNLNTAKALIDRAIAVENAGIFGTWYGSTQFWRWWDENAGKGIYPRSGSFLQGWRYALGLWREDRSECIDYLNISGFLPGGKAPSHCRIKFNDDFNAAAQTNQKISYPAPGNSQSRQPLVVDALGYQGWRDGQSSLGNFNALLNWRKNDQCTVALCKNTTNPAACRASSSDIFAEINTDCVGVADGFMAYNHTSYPVSYLALWPTGWGGTGNGDQNLLAFPEVRTDTGFDDSFSLWFRNTDQVADPRCYSASDFALPPTISCPDRRRLLLSQSISFGKTTFNANNPPVYQVSLKYRALNFKASTALRVRLSVHKIGVGGDLINYGFKTLATLAPGNTGWISASVQFPLGSKLNNGDSYNRIELDFDTTASFSGELAIDAVSVQRLDSDVELAINGSFTEGHLAVSAGDHAANFLNRLNAVAVWGSVGHHQSAGCAFCFNGFETMLYFLRGLPLGDAVWFDESNNSGILYGDPLYSPVAVRLKPFSVADIQSGSVELVGSTVNGRDLLQVITSYRVDVCMANDFYVCDLAQSWQPTGITGQGGTENSLLGTLDTTQLAGTTFTLRLEVTSQNLLSGKSQVFADYFTVSMNDSLVAISENLDVVEDNITKGILAASGGVGGVLSYSIFSNGTKGTATITNANTGVYSYTPKANATGLDSFTFKVSDGLTVSSIAKVSVNISAINNAPVVINTELNTAENTMVSGIFNASDPDGDALIYSIVSNASKGVVVITNASTGAYTYTPNANESGTDSFSLKVSDGKLDSIIATVNVSISAANAVESDSGASGGSQNLLFVLLFSLLSALRMVPVGGVGKRTFLQQGPLRFTIFSCNSMDFD